MSSVGEIIVTVEKWGTGKQTMGQATGRSSHKYWEKLNLTSQQMFSLGIPTKTFNKIRLNRITNTLINENGIIIIIIIIINGPLQPI
jgi:hypothetical protein